MFPHQSSQHPLSHSNLHLPLTHHDNSMMNNNHPNNKSPRNPLEVFVGNLSYFCEENDLYQLFYQYVTVINVRIMRSDDKKRSLMFGFVMLTTRQEVEAICRLLNGHLFMGRHLRVEPSDSSTSTHQVRNKQKGYQIHVAMASSFSTNQIVRPTEALLRKFFMRFGPISDVLVNWYNAGSPMSTRQEGYAFVTFEAQSSYERLLMNPTHVVDGITLVCTKSNGGNNGGFQYGGNRQSMVMMSNFPHRVPPSSTQVSAYEGSHKSLFDDEHVFSSVASSVSSNLSSLPSSFSSLFDTKPISKTFPSSSSSSSSSTASPSSIQSFAPLLSSTLPLSSQQFSPRGATEHL